MSKKYDLDVGAVRDLIEYNPSTGLLYWKEREVAYFSSVSAWKAWSVQHAGMVVGGRPNRCGYLKASLGGYSFVAHRLAWAIYHGRWPDADIDHINGVRTDNRIENLRCVSRADNLKNSSIGSANKSGVMGVYWLATRKVWCASIKVNRRKISLKSTKRFCEAVTARKAAEKKYGFHPNHGKPAQVRGAVCTSLPREVMG